MIAEGETEHTWKGSKSKIYWYLFTILHSTPILNWKMFLFARLSFRMIKGFELNNKRVTEEILIILFGIHFNKLLKLPLQISTRKETRIVLRTQSKEKLIWFKSDKSFLKSLLLRDWPGDVSDLRGDILIRFRLKLFSILGNNILIKKGKEEIWLHLCFESVSNRNSCGFEKFFPFLMRQQFRFEYQNSYFPLKRFECDWLGKTAWGFTNKTSYILLKRKTSIDFDSIHRSLHNFSCFQAKDFPGKLW